MVPKCLLSWFDTVSLVSWGDSPNYSEHWNRAAPLPTQLSVEKKTEYQFKREFLSLSNQWTYASSVAQHLCGRQRSEEELWRRMAPGFLNQKSKTTPKFIDQVQNWKHMRINWFRFVMSNTVISFSGISKLVKVLSLTAYVFAETCIEIVCAIKTICACTSNIRNLLPI